MRAKQVILIASGLFFGAVLALGIMVALWLPDFIEREALRAMRERGLELTSYELDYGFGWVEITKARGRLVDVKSVALSFDRIEVRLAGREPSRIDVSGLAVEANGSAPTLALELAAWTKRFPSTYALPLSATEVSVVWRPRAGESPWLEVAGATIVKTEASSIVNVSEARVAGTPIGKVGATWSATSSSVAIGLGEPELAKAPVKVEATITERPRVVFRLAPTRLEQLAGPFGVKLPVENVTGSGEVELTFGSLVALAPAEGRAHLELLGWIPPHPIELDGFVFGNLTTFDTELALSPDLKTVTLSESRVKAGKFELEGGGTITREEGHALVQMTLAGKLPCPALASAAAESRLGAMLGRAAGKLAGAAARQLVEGSVAVEVRLRADTRELDKAAVRRRIGIGCGIKPLTLEELRKLGELVPMPEELSALADELSKVPPPDLSALPSALPPASSFPKLPALPSGMPALPRVEIDFGASDRGSTKKNAQPASSAAP